MADPIADILGDYRAFAARQRDRLLTRGIDIAPYDLSHLCFRVPEWDQYVHVRTLLEREGQDPGFFDDVDREAAELGETVRADCLAIPEPDLAAWFDNVYAEQTDELRAQQAEYVAWRAQYEPAQAASSRGSRA